jgi:hypothetical protein
MAERVGTIAVGRTQRTLAQRIDSEIPPRQPGHELEGGLKLGEVPHLGYQIELADAWWAETKPVPRQAPSLDAALRLQLAHLRGHLFAA